MTWKSEAEAHRWLYAVEECRTFKETANLYDYLERIATIAGAELGGKPAKDFPETRLPYPDDSE